MLPSRDADTAGLSSQWCVPSPSSTGTSSWSLPSLPTRSYRRRNQTPGGNKGSTQRHIIIKRWHVWWGKTANERRGSSQTSLFDASETSRKFLSASLLTIVAKDVGVTSSFRWANFPLLPISEQVETA